MNTRIHIVAFGDRVILRDCVPSDVESYLRWQTHGEWLLYDAPWENVHAPTTAEEEEAFRARFLKKCRQELPVPRKRATIATLESESLGWVNRYGDKSFSEAYRVGISIGEDAYLNRVWLKTIEAHAFTRPTPLQGQFG